MRAAVLAVIMLVIGFIFGGTLGFAVGGGGTAIFTTTAVVPTALISTVTRLTTVEVTRTYFITSTVTVTKAVATSPVGETYSLRILEVIVDRASEIDHDYYIFTLEATYRGGRSWDFTTLNLNLISDRGYKYSISPSLAERQLMGPVELKDGESAKGQISFKLPKGEEPSKLIYEDKLWGIKIEVTDIPPPSRQVSWIYFAETRVQSEHSVILASASVKTPGASFYSGEEIEVELSIKYSRFLGSPDSITITDITVDKFEVVETDPKPPITLRDGEEAVVKLILRVPEEGYKGNLKITIKA
jgi:hypothetical protein